jgi:hypothetical protein
MSSIKRLTSTLVNFLVATSSIGARASILKLRQTAEGFLGRLYDLTCDWSDDRMYCSELVWKSYDSALGI